MTILTTSAQFYLEDSAAVRRRASVRPDASTVDYVKNPAFSKHFAKLAEIANPVDGREPPSHIAVIWARLILEHLGDIGFEPTRVIPSADGGITICFVRGDVYSDLECLNNGEVLGVTTNRLDRPNVWTVGTGLGAVPRAVDRIRQYLHARASKQDDSKRPWYRLWF